MASRRKAIDFGANPYATPEGNAGGEIEILNDVSRSIASGERVQMITANKLVPSEKNKVIYDVEDIDALAKDISERGIQQPLIVRPRTDGKYIIISGHRRLAANNLAIKKYAYKAGECLPCLLRGEIKNDLEEREALILDNLQRDKSDYNRMMEIVEMRKCAEERRELGENIVNIRMYIIDKLGVSNSEISRFDMIYSSLIPPLMTSFREKKIATNVAFQIAKLNKEAQTYIHENWDREIADGVLTFPAMKSLLRHYNEDAVEEVLPDSIPAEEDAEEASTQIKYDSIEDGLSKVTSQLNDLAIYGERYTSLKNGTKAKLLRRLNKIQKEITSMQIELAKLGLNHEKENGES